VAIGGSYDAVTSTTGQTGNLMTNTNTTFLNLPASVSPTLNPNGAGAQLAFALFNSAANRYLNMEITALEADKRGKVISSPRVVTGDNSKSVIKQGAQVRVVLPGGDGAQGRTETVDANLQLEVVPQITPSGDVLMKLKVAKNRLLNLTPSNITIGVKEVDTEVMVENGGTIVIGGIFEQEEDGDVSKVPYLGDVPGLGWLFKSKSVNTIKTETLIFITPTILEDRGLR